MIIYIDDLPLMSLTQVKRLNWPRKLPIFSNDSDSGKVSSVSSDSERYAVIFS